jgi:hypothetical protein
MEKITVITLGHGFMITCENKIPFETGFVVKPKFQGAKVTNPNSVDSGKKIINIK